MRTLLALQNLSRARQQAIKHCHAVCLGSAAIRLGKQACDLATALPQCGPGHSLFLSDQVLWCDRCGAYAEAFAVGIAAPCRSRPSCDGKRAHLRLLRDNRHPSTKRPFATGPFPEPRALAQLTPRPPDEPTQWGSGALPPPLVAAAADAIYRGVPLPAATPPSRRLGPHNSLATAREVRRIHSDALLHDRRAAIRQTPGDKGTASARLAAVRTRRAPHFRTPPPTFASLEPTLTHPRGNSGSNHRTTTTPASRCDTGDGRVKTSSTTPTGTLLSRDQGDSPPWKRLKISPQPSIARQQLIKQLQNAGRSGLVRTERDTEADSEQLIAKRRRVECSDVPAVPCETASGFPDHCEATFHTLRNSTMDAGSATDALA